MRRPHSKIAFKPYALSWQCYIILTLDLLLLCSWLERNERSLTCVFPGQLTDFGSFRLNTCLSSLTAWKRSPWEPEPVHLSHYELRRCSFYSCYFVLSPAEPSGNWCIFDSPAVQYQSKQTTPQKYTSDLLHSFKCTARCSAQPPYSHNINLKALPLYLYVHLLFAMNLSLVKDRPRNTTLISPDGRAMYHVNTPSKLFGSKTTTIRRVDVGDGDIGRINWHAFSNTELWVRERLIQPHKSGTFSSWVPGINILCPDDVDSFIYQVWDFSSGRWQKL